VGVKVAEDARSSRAPEPDLEPIGEGAFGEVYRAFDSENPGK
jgi:hypothetical protein